jgi:hypothetical protein
LLLLLLSSCCLLLIIIKMLLLDTADHPDVADDLTDETRHAACFPAFRLSADHTNAFLGCNYREVVDLGRHPLTSRYDDFC